MIAVGEHKSYWGRLCRRMLFWLSAELVLTVMGVDDLIDYIEYLGNRQQLIILPQLVLSSLPALPKEPVDETCCEAVRRSSTVIRAGDYWAAIAP